MKTNSRNSGNSRTAKNLRQLRRKLSRRSMKRSTELQYESLEPKLPLDASFSFSDAGDGFLSFDNFTPGESVFITRNADGDLVASLQNGDWQGGFADPAEGTVAGGFLTVEADFEDFSIQGLTDGSVITFGGNADLADVEVDISSTTDFTVLQNGSGGDQSGFDVGELRITGGTSQIFDVRSNIDNLILNDVISFEYSTDDTINTETLTTVPGGSIVLSSDNDIILDSVDIPGTLVVNADGNVIRDNQNNAVEVTTFFLNVDGNVDIEHLRATEIGGIVDGDFTITDSDFFLSNVDTTIVNDVFTAPSGFTTFSTGLFVDGNLDWEIRFRSNRKQSFP